MSHCVIDSDGCIVCAGVPATTGSPASTSLFPNLGWNAGADSVDSLDDNLHVIFTMALVAGAVVGFKPDSSGSPDPSQIKYGLQFQTIAGIGFVNIVESGVPQGGRSFEYAAGDTFEIRRYNGVVSYLHGDSVLGTSSVRSGTPLIVSASLYAAGDTVGTITFEAFTDHTPGTASIDGLHSSITAFKGKIAEVSGLRSSITATVHTGLKVVIHGVPSSVIATDATSYASINGLDSTVSASYFTRPSVSLAFVNGLNTSTTIRAHREAHIDLALTGVRSSVLATNVAHYASFSGLGSSVYANDIGPFDGALVVAMQSPGFMELVADAPIYSLRSGFDMGEFTSAQLTYALADGLVAADSLNSVLGLMASLHDGLDMIDRLQFFYTLLARSGFKFSDTPSIALAAELVDVLRIAAGPGATLAILQAVAEAIAFADVLQHYRSGAIVDGVVFGEVFAQSVNAWLTVLDAAVFGDSSAYAIRFNGVIEDGLKLGDTPAASLAAMLSMADGIGLAVSLRLADTIFYAWAMNARTHAPSLYENYPFNSFAPWKNGRVFGCGDTGIYEIGVGDTDAGADIKARVRMGLNDYGTGKLKRMPSLYLGYTSDGALALRVITTSPDGHKIANDYLLVENSSQATREARIKVGRGLQSVWWDFELRNIDGAAFSIDAASLLPLVLDRRIRSS